MDSAIRNTESKLNTRLTEIRRSYNNMLLRGAEFDLQGGSDSEGKTKEEVKTTCEKSK